MLSKVVNLVIVWPGKLSSMLGGMKMARIASLTARRSMAAEQDATLASSIS